MMAMLDTVMSMVAVGLVLGAVVWLVVVVVAKVPLAW